MSELLAEFFRELLLALANPAAVNDDVTFIGNAINFDSTEVKSRLEAKARGSTEANLPKFMAELPASR